MADDEYWLGQEKFITREQHAAPPRCCVCGSKGAQDHCGALRDAAEIIMRLRAQLPAPVQEHSRCAFCDEEAGNVGASMQLCRGHLLVWKMWSDLGRGGDSEGFRQYLTDRGVLALMDPRGPRGVVLDLHERALICFALGVYQGDRTMRTGDHRIDETALKLLQKIAAVG